MERKIIGILICTLLITTTTLPVAGIINEESKGIIENYLSKESNKETSAEIIQGSDSGGVQQGVRIRQTGRVHQNKYDEATDLHMKIWQEEDNIDVNGWSITISGFPNVNSQLGNQPTPYTNQLKNHPDVRPFSNDPDNGKHAVDIDADGASIPRCTWITIQWTWWLTHENTKRVADFEWTRDGDEDQAAPNHGWNLDPPEQDPNTPTRYFHYFTFSNDDDEEFTVCNLSFLATMDWYDNLTDINFPPPYDCFILQPGDDYFQNIITTGPLYGGHIYFKYDIIESSGKLNDEPIFKDVADHPITGGPDIVEIEPDVPGPWPTWEIIAEGLGCTVEYGEIDTTDPPIVITPSYVTLQEYIDISSLTWEETQDLPWIPLDTIVIIPGYSVDFIIPMNFGDIAALLRFEVAFEDEPENIIERFIAEAILDAPWPEFSGINNEFTNFAVCNFHDVNVDTLQFNFKGFILPDAIEGWYDPDPPGSPYLSGDIWYGGWGCPPEIISYDIEDGIDITWIDIDTEIQPDQWVYFGLSIDPRASIYAIPDVNWGNYWENTIPNKPDKPSGPASGKVGTKYTYSTKTTDPDGDESYYMWNWGDGTTSGWTGLYPSGQQVSESHTWSEKGSYDITVKSKDFYGYESDWSDPFSISIPRSRSYNSKTFAGLLAGYIHLFPILRILLQQLG